MVEIVSDYKNSRLGEFAIARDGQSVKKENLEEYNALLDMKNIATNGFKTKNYYDYMDLRCQTKLGQLDDYNYALLMGRTFEKSDKTLEELFEENQKNKNKNNNNRPEPEPEPEPELEPEPEPELELEPELESEPELEDTPKEPTTEEPDEELQDKPDAIEDPDEEPKKVTKVSVWNWIKKHKKQILIALGVTALTVALVVALTQLMPAVAAAAKASQIAGMAGQMTTNSQLWFASQATEKIALHGANTQLASIISSISGVPSSFASSSGIWTFGSQTLSQFASSSGLAASTLAGKVSELTMLSKGLGIGGLSLFGAGVLLPKSKSAEYKKIKEKLNKLKKQSKTISNEQFQVEYANIIEMIKNKNLTEQEKNILNKKLSIIEERIKFRNTDEELRGAMI